MRDTEFAEIFIKLTPRLEKFFRDRMKKPVPGRDKALMTEDLVQLTAALALENSRKTEYDNYPIRELLFEKAKNVWWEYSHPPKKTISTELLSELPKEPTTSPTALHRLLAAEYIENIRQVATSREWHTYKMREEGYSYEEIAKMMKDDETNLRKVISRLRAKIKLKWKDTGLL